MQTRVLPGPCFRTQISLMPLSVEIGIEACWIAKAWQQLPSQMAIGIRRYRPVSPYPYCHLTWKLLPRFRYPAGFNPNLYRERHQADLRSEAWAWQDPGLHYALFGQREGRAAA